MRFAMKICKIIAIIASLSIFSMELVSKESKEDRELRKKLYKWHAGNQSYQSYESSRNYLSIGLGIVEGLANNIQINDFHKEKENIKEFCDYSYGRLVDMGIISKRFELTP